MTIGQWFSFQGRIGRKTWWLGYFLPLVGIAIVASILDVMLGFVSVVPQDAAPADGFAVETSGLGVFGVASLVLSVVGGLAGQVKRWHDRDKSGWWVMINLVPLIGPIWSLIEVGILRGTVGPNRFGPDPLGGAGAAQWQPGMPQQAWQQQPQWQPQPPPQQWQGQGWQPPPQQWQPPPAQGWEPPPQGYPPNQQDPGAPPPGYGQPPPAPPGPWQGPGRGGSVPPVRRD